MMWTITLTQVEVQARIGILSQEHEPQRIWVDVAIEVDYPIVPERVSECADYATIYNYIQSLSEKPHTPLLETVAHELIRFIFAELPRVKAATCKIQKPDIFPHAKAVGVTLTRKRD